MFEQIDQLEKQAMADLASVKDAADLEQYRIKYLGAKGAIKRLMGALKQIPSEDKPRFGQAANRVRQQVQEAFNQKRASLDGASRGRDEARYSKLDITEPGVEPRLGRTHVITQTIDSLVEVFGRMGFDVATGPEVEDDRHNFVALNIPEHHPARDPLDNFYLNTPGSGEGGSAHLLRSQTSTVQIRVMEKTQPPIRVVALGRVYRPDEHDATHSSMFHQIEGLYVDRDVSMVDLKTTLMQFAHAYFGPEAEVRLRPSYFPFTEPSAELDIKMRVKDRWDWGRAGRLWSCRPGGIQSRGVRRGSVDGVCIWVGD